MGWNGDWNHMDGGWGVVGGVMMILWIVLLVVAIAAIVAWLLRADTRTRDASRDDPTRLLDERYARGEIDDETWQRMRDNLRGRQSS